MTDTNGKASKDPIPFNRPLVSGRETEYIAEAVRRGHLSGDGPFTLRCHAWLEERLGCRRALLTPSCTAALEMAAILADIRPGDEVILPSFTFVSTANAFVLRGGVPVFVDIREDTFNLDERLVEAAVTQRTKAVVPVHYAGFPCAMEEILAIAKSRNLLVIEDAAQAILSTYRGKALGAIGHLGCLSFHETKNIVSGEGGALLINDERLIARAETIREKGTDRSRFFRGEVDKYTWQDVGSSYLPGEIIGAFLYAQLEAADGIIARRREILERYQANLAPLAEAGVARLHGHPEGVVGNGHLFPLLTRSLEERTRLIGFLKNRGVHAVFHYVPLHSSPAGRRFGRPHGALDVTNRISDTLVRLPLHFGLTDEEVDRVSDAVRAFYR